MALHYFLHVLEEYNYIVVERVPEAPLRTIRRARGRGSCTIQKGKECQVEVAAFPWYSKNESNLAWNVIKRWTGRWCLQPPLGAHKYEKERGYGKPSVSNRYPELWRSVKLTQGWRVAIILRGSLDSRPYFNRPWIEANLGVIDESIPAQGKLWGVFAYARCVRFFPYLLSESCQSIPYHG